MAEGSLTFHGAATLDELAEQAVALVATPVGGPLEAEWIATPSLGVQRWFSQRLSRSLGATKNKSDGISANIDWNFPDALRSAVLLPKDAATSFYSIDAMTWKLAGILREANDDILREVTHLQPGATLIGRARKIADLFDRYLRRRPEMLRRWGHGEDCLASGEPLAQQTLWQPYLWRLLMDQSAIGNPIDQMDLRFDELRNGTLVIDLPERLIFFGLQVLPGGSEFLQLLEAAAHHREIHVFLVIPSPALAEKSSVYRGSSPVSAPRDSELMSEVANQPLLRSWGRSFAETSWLLGDHLPASTQTEPADSVLGAVQQLIMSDAAPSHHSLDQSLHVIGCAGMARQVEVTRDVLLHALDEDKSLRENEIAVICPNLIRFAPVLESVLGPSAYFGRTALDPTQTPSLRYQIADRSLAKTVPIIDSLLTFLATSVGRIEGSALCDLLQNSFVAQALGLDDESSGRAVELIRESEVRWGLNLEHRERFDLPQSVMGGTWVDGCDRLLLGVTTSSHGVQPTDLPGLLRVEGDDIVIVGKIRRLAAAMEFLVDAAHESRTPARWLSDIVIPIAESFLDVDLENSWQTSTRDEWLSELAKQVEDVALEISLDDVRSWLTSSADETRERSSLFDGSVTIASFLPVRSVPFKLIVLLGLDEDALLASRPSIDDLVALDPLVGDPDARDDVRSSLLMTLMSAKQQLIIIRNDTDENSSEEIPAAGILEDLLDTVELFGLKKQDIASSTPRHSFSEEAFAPVGPFPEAPFSFDVMAARGADLRRTPSPIPPTWAELPDLDYEAPSDISLDELHRFFEDPASRFVKERLGMWTHGFEVDATDELAVEIDALAKSSLRSSLIAALIDHPQADFDGVVDAWFRAHRHDPRMPPGALSRIVMEKVVEPAREVATFAQGEGLVGEVDRISVSLDLAHGRRIYGDVPLYSTSNVTGMIRPSKSGHYRCLGPWIDLLVLQGLGIAPHASAVMLSHDDKKPLMTKFLEKPSGTDPTSVLEKLLLVHDLGQRSPLPLHPRSILAALSDESDQNIINELFYKPDKTKPLKVRSDAGKIYGCLPDNESAMAQIPVREIDQEVLGLSGASRALAYAKYVAALVSDSVIQLDGADD